MAVGHLDCVGVVVVCCTGRDRNHYRFGKFASCPFQRQRVRAGNGYVEALVIAAFASYFERAALLSMKAKGLIIGVGRRDDCATGPI